METYDRYKLLKKNDENFIAPSITLNVKKSDFYEIYKQGSTRLDILSYNYYSDPNYDWLILMANPEYGSMEFNIPNNTILRIPYPLEVTIQEYETKIKKYLEEYK